jgi:hypothetical protein
VDVGAKRRRRAIALLQTGRSTACAVNRCLFESACEFVDDCGHQARSAWVGHPRIVAKALRQMWLEWSGSHPFP